VLSLRSLSLFGRDGYVCFEFPTLPQFFFGKFFQPKEGVTAVGT
jgi:hypothetical protein